MWRTWGLWQPCHIHVTPGPWELAVPYAGATATLDGVRHGVPKDAGEADLSTTSKGPAHIPVELPVVVNGATQTPVRAIDHHLNVGNGHPGIGHHDLAVPGVAALKAEPEFGATSRALYWVPLNLPPAITSYGQVQISVLALRALIGDEAILPGSGDGIAPEPLALAPELHAHATGSSAQVLTTVDGKGGPSIPWRVPKTVEVEAAMPKSTGLEAIVCSITAESVAEERVLWLCCYHEQGRRNDHYPSQIDNKGGHTDARSAELTKSLSMLSQIYPELGLDWMFSGNTLLHNGMTIRGSVVWQLSMHSNM